MTTEDVRTWNSTTAHSTLSTTYWSIGRRLFRDWEWLLVLLRGIFRLRVRNDLLDLLDRNKSPDLSKTTLSRLFGFHGVSHDLPLRTSWT